MYMCTHVHEICTCMWAGCLCGLLVGASIAYSTSRHEYVYTCMNNMLLMVYITCVYKCICTIMYCWCFTFLQLLKRFLLTCSSVAVSQSLISLLTHFLGQYAHVHKCTCIGILLNYYNVALYYQTCTSTIYVHCIMEVYVYMYVTCTHVYQRACGCALNFSLKIM